MLSVRQNAVELLGGPFDGQRRQLPPHVEELERFLALPINSESLAAFEHDAVPQEPDLRAACVAIYELETGDELHHYRFAFVTATKQSFLEGWLL